MPTKFRIARGTDARIQEQSKSEGQVYFATDTGKIYYDVNSTDRIVMGASGVAIHYGKAPADLKPDSEYLNGTFFLLSIQEHLVDPDELIAIDDLVFNNDGTFYKVHEKDETTLYCEKLAVAGGGNGGGGGGVPTATIAKITIETPDNINLINGQAASIKFTVKSATESDGSSMDEKLTVTWQLAEKKGNQWITYHNGTGFYAYDNEPTTLDFGAFLRHSTTSRLTLFASGINSGEANSKYVEFSTSELILAKAASFSNLKTFDPDKITVECNVTGNMNKILDYYFDGVLIHSKELSPTATASQIYTIPTTFNNKPITTHGAHALEVKLFQAVSKNGKWERALSVAPIKMEIAVKEALNPKPIIWLGEYQDVYLNYDDIRIPFLVYDPASTETTTVRLWKDGLPTASPTREVPSSNYTSFNYFEITDAVLGMKNYYAITCGIGDNETKREIEFEVKEDPNRKMEIVKKDYLRLLFEAKGRSNEESVSNRQNWHYTNALQGVDVSAVFNNFNWYNNGWKPDDEGHTCLRISNGAEFILPIGETTLNGGGNSNSSWTYEMQFKIRNIQDYTPLIQNITRYKDDGAYYEAFTAEDQKQYTNYDSFLTWYLPQINKRYDDLEFDYVYKKINLSKVACGYYSGDQNNATGFCFGSQDAFFSNGTNTVSVSYVENEMVYLTMVFSDTDQRIYIYINGMLTGAINSTVREAFKILSNGVKFNSDYCDIDLYQFRIYNTALNVYDVVMNHAVDTKDIDIYDLCEIATENNAIKEYQLKLGSETEAGVVKYNTTYPHKHIMPYIIFDTTKSTTKELPYSKANDVTARVTFKNTGLDYAYSSGLLEELAIADGLCSANATPDEKVEAVKKYYLHHCPSFTGNNVTMAVQGTSSEFYPRRNYKLKFKDSDDNINFWMNAGPFENDYIIYGEKLEVEKVAEDEQKEMIQNPCHTDWFYMNNYDVGTTKFTMKIDYMESSGSYNGGFCRLVHNAYSKHPLEDYQKANAFTNADKLPEVTSLRTNVDGYPVLAFHKKGENNYQYIGRYNMLLDKGSDEAYGFKVDKKITANYVGDKAVRKIAECWEFSDNSRTYCSFRDPEERKELSFLVPPRSGNALDEIAGYRTNAKGSAPIVCDSFEYRYHDGGDVMDYIYDPDKNADKYEDALEAFPTPGEGVENTLNIDNVADRGTIIKKYYKNWEKLCQWVWSTCTDHVPSQGTPTLRTDVGEKAWKANTFYVQQGEEYILDPGTEFNADTDYYEKGTDEYGKTIYIHANVNLIAYTVNTYYININNKYVLSSDAFDSAQTYYTINVDEAMLAKNADRLVTQCTADSVYDANTEYYTYDPTAKNNEAVKLVEGLTAEAFDADKTNYYVGITKQYGNNIHKYDTKEYRNDKFKAELDQHFDIEYLSTYFVMTEVFECYDSRGKNCMMASWGPLTPGGDYVWYPIFYDLDTQLGINNTGIPSFTYSVDASEAGNYSTSDSVLWNNFYANFKSTHILQKYRQLKGEKGISSAVGGSNPRIQGILKDVDAIEKWYNADPEECGWMCKDGETHATNFAMAGQRPLIALNLDEYYKFLTIYNTLGSSESVSTKSELYGTTGRIDGSGKFVKESTDYLYALQGDRSLSRRQFLTNRITYIDSWLNVGNFARGGAQRLWGRVQANNTNISDFWVETKDNPYWLDTDETQKAHEFDAEYWMTVTPIHDSYVTFGGDNENWPSKKFSGTPLKFNIDSIEPGFRTSNNYKEQLLYVYGIDQMRDLGDLSKMYWTEFKVEGDANKLTRLKMGHDAYMTDNNNEVLYDDNGQPIRWYNNKMNPPSFSAGGMPLLKEMNFCNITINTANNGSTSLDLSKSEKLENFRATGSNLTDVSFAPGVALNTLYLPPTVTKLELIEARLLNNVLDAYEVPKKNKSGEIEATPGLYVKGLTDMVDGTSDAVTSIAQFNITGDYFGYDSYKLMQKYYKNRLKNTSTHTVIKLTDVKWSPYIQLIKGDTYDEKRTYKRDNGHYGLEDYEYNITTFDLDVENGEIYVLDEAYKTANDNVITDISMLNAFIDEALLIGVGENSTIPELTGIMYVNNSTPVDELLIKNKIVKNFPKLNIFFANVTKAVSGKFILPDFDDDGNYLGTYSYVSDGKTEELSIQKIATDSWFENPYAKYKPEKPNYDFLGWSTSRNKADLISDAHASAEDQAQAWANARPDELETDYVFYALFEKHPYIMEFYSNKQLVDTFPILYGYNLENSKVIPSHTDDSLALEEVYGFIGWTENENTLVVESETEAKLVDFSQMRAVRNYKFYACYKKKSVYDNVADVNLFDFIDDEWEGYSGYRINLKPDVQISGKITLPAKGIANGQEKMVVSVGQFAKGSKNLTHIFFEKNNEVRFIYPGNNASSGSFYACTNLKYFEMPATLLYIGNYAFNQSGLEVCHFPKGLKEIGQRVFANFQGKAFKDGVQIPGSVERVQGRAFQYTLVPITQITFGGPGDPTMIAKGGVESTSFQNDQPQKNAKIVYYSSTTPPDVEIEDTLGIIQIDGANSPYDLSGVLA